jgi:type VI secretion system protein ImpI
MPSEFIVRVTMTAPFQNVRAAPTGRGARTQEYRFSKLPISIGRAPDNDLQIPSQFVSGSHARIEELGGTLCVRDLGSRNGVCVVLGAERVRIAPHSTHPVSPEGFELQLGSEITVRVERNRRAPVEPPGRREQAAPPRGIAVASSSLLAGLDDGLPPLPHLRRPPRPLPPLDVPLGAGSELDAGSLSLPFLSAHHPGGAPLGPGPAVRGPPSAGVEPVRPKPGGHAGGEARCHETGLKTGDFELGPELLALQGLRELVASLAPGRTIDTQGDVARLITRLHDTLEVVCRGYRALRDGHAKFVASFRLQASGDACGRSALATARDPSAIAGLLLDFREQAPNASHALEQALEELGLHQVALLDGVMQGIRALLAELSPVNIQQGVERKGSAPPLGRPERALWDEYCQRYARLTQEGEAFSRVFGEEFSSAYRRYRQLRRSR